jgi:hypothetical protein
MMTKRFVLKLIIRIQLVIESQIAKQTEYYFFKLNSILRNATRVHRPQIMLFMLPSYYTRHAIRD